MERNLPKNNISGMEVKLREGQVIIRQHAGCFGSIGTTIPTNSTVASCLRCKKTVLIDQKAMQQNQRG